MAYAGNEYGAGGAFAGDTNSTAQHPVTHDGSGVHTMAGAVVIGSVVALIAIRMGFRGVSVSHVTGGLVKA